MKVEIEELGGCKRRLQVEEAPEVVSKAWEQAFDRVQREAKLPGFRKGKVPRSMIKLHFADDVRQEVARHLIPDVYRQALAETRIEPVEEPDLQEVTLEENAALKFAAVVEVKPVITLGAYTGLAVEHTPKPFAETEVDEALGTLQEQHAEYRAVERAADPGDLVIVDYTLTPEGQEPRSETGYGFVIGGGSVLPEIEEAVIGLDRGRLAPDAGALRRRPPQRGAARQVGRGQRDGDRGEGEGAARARRRASPRRVGGNFETLDALRTEVRKGLAARRDADNRRALETAVLDAVLAGHTFEVPEALVLRQVGHQIEHAREHMRRQGVDPDKVPWDYKKLLEDLRPGAEKAVKRALLIEAIAEKEGLAAADADVDAEVERVAQASQRPAPAVRRMLEQSGDLEGIRHSLGERRTIDFLIEKNQAKTA